MSSLNQIIAEIKRHKGVLLEDELELADFAQELFYGACTQLGLQRTDVTEQCAEFVENKYRQVLISTVALYEQNPSQREFYFRPQWDDLPHLQQRLAQRYMEIYKQR